MRPFQAQRLYQSVVEKSISLNMLKMPSSHNRGYQLQLHKVFFENVPNMANRNTNTEEIIIEAIFS